MNQFLIVKIISKWFLSLDLFKILIRIALKHSLKKNDNIIDWIQNGIIQKKYNLWHLSSLLVPIHRLSQI